MKYFNLQTIFSAFLFILFSYACGVKSPGNSSFQGKMIYSVNSDMHSPEAKDSINYQIIYTNDSMVRIESFTPIGKQIYIEHIPKNRAYILMDLGHKQVAIQTYTEPDSVNQDKYAFKPKFGSKKFAGQKAKKIEVINKVQDTTMTMYYLPDISPKYINALEGIPGLPTKYSVYSGGLWINYELKSMEERAVPKDYFGIPNTHEIITLDEFIELLKN
ncbi:MAG: hypothetical protein R3277_10535 [Brumimicrobium sp.]|nr:hypothetical protein [Brumimicrobium sp.]